LLELRHARPSAGEVLAPAPSALDFPLLKETLGASDQKPGKTSFHHKPVRGQQVPIEDVDNEDGYEDHRGAAADAGYRAVVSTPLRNDAGTVIGVFSLHYAKPRLFDGFELARFGTKAERAGPLVARHLHGQ
jgi:GAF domain-containing protein